MSPHHFSPSSKSPSSTIVPRCRTDPWYVRRLPEGRDSRFCCLSTTQVGGKDRLVLMAAKLWWLPERLVDEPARLAAREKLLLAGRMFGTLTVFFNRPGPDRALSSSCRRASSSITMSACLILSRARIVSTELMAAVYCSNRCSSIPPVEELAHSTCSESSTLWKTLGTSPTSS